MPEDVDPTRKPFIKALLWTLVLLMGLGVVITLLIAKSMNEEPTKSAPPNTVDMPAVTSGDFSVAASKDWLDQYKERLKDDERRIYQYQTQAVSADDRLKKSIAVIDSLTKRLDQSTKANLELYRLAMEQKARADGLEKAMADLSKWVPTKSSGPITPGGPTDQEPK